MITDDSRQLFRETRSAITLIQMLLDQIVVQGLLVLHTYLRTGGFPEEYLTLAFIVFLLMQIIYEALGVYRHESARVDYMASLLQAWGALLVALGVFGFISKTSEEFSREVILTWGLSGFFGQLLVFYITRKVIFRATRERIPTLVVGSGELARHITSNINQNPWIPDIVVGFVTDHQGDTGVWPENVEKLGTTSDLLDIVVEHNIRRVYLAMPMQDAHFVKPLALDLVEASIDVIWAPDIFGVSLLNHSIKEIAGVPLISLSETPLTGSAALMKDAIDKAFASLALIIASPVMIITALAVKLTSPGPVLFKQKRHGWDGRVVEIYKFRSMRVHVEDEGKVTQAKRDDDRITPVGKFIRRTSIDELPQLFNVLGGSMSLVGPRPHAVAHNDYYKDKIRSYMLRHRIKPGLTGLAQVHGFRGETETLEKMQGRVNYDMAYINNWSLWLDIEILFRTVFVLFGKNAY